MIPRRPVPDELDRVPVRGGRREFRWFSIVMACLALVGWAVHWHVAVTNTTVLPSPINYNLRAMSDAGCRSIRPDEPESVVHAMYGTDRGVTSDDSNHYVLVSWDHDADYYKLPGAKKTACDVYYNGDHRVAFVYEELLP